MPGLLDTHIENVAPPTNGYPTRDGRPMAESDFHRELMFDVINTLRAWYAQLPDVYVTGNLLLCYERSNKRRHVAPDCFVAFGVPNHKRLNYLLWAEGVPPSVVIEITSPTTAKEDLQTKFELYRDVIRVREYFLFDGLGEYLTPQLQGYRLQDGAYQPIEAIDGRLNSEALNLSLKPVGDQLRFWNSKTQSWIPTLQEREIRSDQTTKKAVRKFKAQQKKLKETQRQVAALEAELDRLRGTTNDKRDGS